MLAQSFEVGDVFPLSCMVLQDHDSVNPARSTFDTPGGSGFAGCIGWFFSRYFFVNFCTASLLVNGGSWLNWIPYSTNSGQPTSYQPYHYGTTQRLRIDMKGLWLQRYPTSWSKTKRCNQQPATKHIYLGIVRLPLSSLINLWLRRCWPFSNITYKLLWNVTNHYQPNIE